MAALEARTPLVRNPDMVCGDVDGELIALKLDTGSYLHLNAPASRILALFEEQARPLSPQDICVLLEREYEVNESDCLRDVLAMAQRCLELDLLRPAQASTTRSSAAMGAIFGLVELGGAPVDATRWQRAARAASEFGRDGLHSWVDGSVALGRAVLLARPRSAPERTTQSAGLAHLHAVASGRLDAREPLLAPLQLSPECTDLELILAAYARWGPRCAERLHGDLAFALWDARQRRLLCVRDRCGLRPFHFRRRGNTIAFASSLPLLAELDGAGSALDPDACAALFARLPLPPHASAWRDTERLPPGCRLQLSDGELRIERYWRAQARDPGCRHETEWAEAGREVLQRAVTARIADTSAPPGLTLSGGLDSSLLLALAAGPRGDARLHGAASVLPPGHPGPERDDRVQLDLLIQRFPGLALDYLVAPDGDPLAVDRWAPIWSRLGRSGNAFHLLDQALMEQLRARGARTALSGFWGDGTLSYAGHGWLQEHFSWTLARRIAQHRGVSVLRVLGGELKRWVSQGSGRRSDDPPASLLSAARRRALPHGPRASLSSAPGTLLPAALERGFASVEEVSLGAAAAGIELSMPFLDPAVIEFVLAVPAAVFVAEGRPRGLARLAMRGLVPEPIRLRKDKLCYWPGFAAQFRAVWPSYCAEVAAVRADPKLRVRLSQHLDLDRLASIFAGAAPAGTGFGEEGELLRAACAMTTLRFLCWQAAKEDGP